MKKDLFFYNLTFDADEVTVTGFVEYLINYRANGIDEGYNLEELIFNDAREYIKNNNLSYKVKYPSMFTINCINNLTNYPK